MWIGNGSTVAAERERIKEKIKNEMRRKGFGIGIVVTKTFHPKGCKCWGCLTNPGSFCPFPEEHKQFYDMLFSAVAE